MAEGDSKLLFLCLLAILTTCSSEVSPPKQFEQIELKRGEKQIVHSAHRAALLYNSHYKATQHDTIYPPATTFPATPVTTSPDTYPTPVIVSVPSSTPVTVPSNMPVPTPYTNPGNSALPITNPVTTPSTVPGAQPVTNPVTTYPVPSGVPVTTPVTNPVAPPATTGSPALPGQSWCVAKSGVPEAALQAALDYACGIGGADCSVIQQGASCYNPTTLQSHASYAFNSYYQKNPVQTSCDFGGTAMITNSNPSIGTCIFPSSSSSAQSTSPMTTTYPSPTTITYPSPAATTNPSPTTITYPSPAATTNPSPATATSSSGGTVPGTGSPPTVLNTSSNPATASPAIYGESPPTPNVESSTSKATGVQPLIGCIILVTSIVTGRFILDMK